jgi:hypothetical protein
MHYLFQCFYRLLMGCNNTSHLKYDIYNLGFVEINSLDLNNNIITLDMKWEFYWKQLLLTKLINSFFLLPIFRSLK